jgi:hypothetical protein
VKLQRLCHVYGVFLDWLAGPLRSTGHTATVVSSKLKKSERMIIIFGHSPIYGYLNTVQEYHFGELLFALLAVWYMYGCLRISVVFGV